MIVNKNEILEKNYQQKNGGAKVQQCLKLPYEMSKLVIEDELKDRHNLKKYLKNVITRLTSDLERKANLILLNKMVY